MFRKARILGGLSWSYSTTMVLILQISVLLLSLVWGGEKKE
jgi:hypothetical protein